MTTNLVRRYYLTRELVAYCNLRDKILEIFRCVSTQPDCYGRNQYIYKRDVQSLLQWGERLVTTIKYLKRQLAEAGGGF